MDKDERKELTFRQMLALGADYPSWWYGLIAAIGIGFLLVELINGRFEVFAIYVLVTVILHAKTFFNKLPNR